jgi:thiol-disulfide isomerase/thioredoxin
MLPILTLILASIQTPADAEAISWQARAALAQKNYAEAEALAAQAYQYARTLNIQKDPKLQTALGAAIEVQSQILAARGERAEAVTYLRGQLKTYFATPIRERIQKNLNLLNLEGKPAPPLDTSHMMGSKPAPLTKGHPVLLFFWAHWCTDCKAEAPYLAQMPRDLVVIAPTQHYGYVGATENIPRAEETKYIDQIRQQFYPNFAVPLSEENFKTYGASTTPTIVLIDRQGIVRLYHPGIMNPQELQALAAKL